MASKLFEQGFDLKVSRRRLLQSGAGVIGGTMLSGGGLVVPAMAVGQSPIGTWPAGSQGDTVYIDAVIAEGAAAVASRGIKIIGVVLGLINHRLSGRGKSGEE